MNKITEPGYNLPEIFAQRFDDELPNSANKPFVITGIDKNNLGKGSWVVKCRNSGRMSEEASMRELLAGFIAMEMGIPVVEPAIIDLNSDFVETLKGTDAWMAGSKSAGKNYGSKYLPAFQTLLLTKPLNNHQLPVAQDIFAFDMFIQNADRTMEKPNLLTNGNEMFMLDHELAFGFIFAPFISPFIWNLKENQTNWIRGHCLLPLIRGREFDFTRFFAKFDTLTVDFWQKAFNLIPENWRTNQFEEIKNILTRISVSRKEFIQELKMIMS